ncbi:hypothetical protein LB503_008190 [Fusarium chuoi]|nr:hypothetical protein LB503_008190 [Fusarium chuoi]
MRLHWWNSTPSTSTNSKMGPSSEAIPIPTDARPIPLPELPEFATGAASPSWNLYQTTSPIHYGYRILMPLIQQRGESIAVSQKRKKLPSFHAVDSTQRQWDGHYCSS